jgi:hypothetical protein
MPESLEILRMVERGYLRVGDIARFLGVSSPAGGSAQRD